MTNTGRTLLVPSADRRHHMLIDMRCHKSSFGKDLTAREDMLSFCPPLNKTLHDEYWDPIRLFFRFSVGRGSIGSSHLILALKVDSSQQNQITGLAKLCYRRGAKLMAISKRGETAGVPTRLQLLKITGDWKGGIWSDKGPDRSGGEWQMIFYRFGVCFCHLIHWGL